ncbi:MAG TPA: hypothetical protein VMF89_00895, partial [Polyangiales bacterium]|nr:hypothetical protein [Polyangiales bacterium]
MSRPRKRSGPARRALLERSAQHEQLLHLLWIVEHVNADAAALGDVEYLSDVLEHTRRELGKAAASSARSAVLHALATAGLLPQPNEALLERQFGWLSASCKPTPQGALERLLPEVKQQSVPARFLEESLSSPVASEPQPDAPHDICPIVLVDEALDPIA